MKIKWSHPGVTIEEVVKNTKEMNKLGANAPTEKQVKVTSALNGLPNQYRESIRVILEEVTGEKYPNTNTPVAGTFIVITGGYGAGRLCVVRHPREADWGFTNGVDKRLILCASLNDRGVIL